jgi:hypothetical protein
VNVVLNSENEQISVTQVKELCPGFSDTNVLTRTSESADNVDFVSLSFIDIYLHVDLVASSLCI